MKLSAAHSFVRWEGAPLTPLQEQVIDALERQRVLTGRVRAVVHVTDATDCDIEWILLRYTHYLHHTFTPRGRILVVDTNTRIASARYNGAAPSLRHFVLCRGGSRRFGTRGYGTVEQALAFRMDRYGRGHAGDPRTFDVLSNLVASVPDAPGTALIFVGRHHPGSRRAFSLYYRRVRSLGPATIFITLDTLRAPSLREIHPIERPRWLLLAHIKQKPPPSPPRLKQLNKLSQLSPPSPPHKRSLAFVA